MDDSTSASGLDSVFPRSVQLQGIWHVGTFDERIVEVLNSVEPEATSILASFRGSYPVAATCLPFEAGDFARPVGHARSFNMRLARGGQLVFKGSEPFASDLEDWIGRAFSAREIGMHSAIDNFALLEHEVFLGVRRASALQCASISAEYVSAYIKSHGHLPRAPIPLEVLAVPDEIVQGYYRLLKPFLSDRRHFSARNFAEHLLQEGLAVYVYYMSGTSTRLAHAKNIFPGGEALWRWAASSPHEFDLEMCVRSWCQQFAEMLALGFVPTTPVHTGNCMQSQNLTIDGGLTDIDSVERIDRLRPSEVFDAIVFSLYELTRSVLVAIGEPNKEHVPATGFVFSGLWREIRRVLDSDAVQPSPATQVVEHCITRVDDLSLLWRRDELDERTGHGSGPA